MDYFTTDDVWDLFHKMSYQDQIGFLFKALELMRQEPRTNVICIALAMGFETKVHEGEFKLYRLERNIE